MSFHNDKSQLKANRREGYDLFISHSWKYNSDYNRLEGRLDDRNYFSYRNYSVTKKEKVEGKSNPALKRHIKNKQIKPASVVVVLAGMYSEYSDWIGKEVRIAEELDKPVLGVKPWGSKRTPSYITRKADKMVGWNTKTIVRGIRELSP